MTKKSDLLFSQRTGIKPIKNIIQTDNIDKDLRNSLWSAVDICYWKRLKGGWLSDDRYRQNLVEKIWLHYFKRPLDTLKNDWTSTWMEIREYFFSCQWFEIYDFIEFIANNYSVESTNDNFMNTCNSFLERELSAYRFVGGVITPITSEEEIVEIEKALEADFLKSVNEHLKAALSLFADRKSPDYRNSIKESISAVEAISKLVTQKPKATLGDALEEIESNVEIHGALKKAFNSLYGYTSDEQGIRHSLLDESNLDCEDAKFMLVACSAFINYLIAKSAKSGIEF